MERRGFLRLLGLGGAAMVLDPERALWVPGRVTTFDLGAVPACGVRYRDGFTTVEWIAREALGMLEQNLRVMAAVNREYDTRYLMTEPVRWS
jgi:predicted fused transcriptional regulator/phosphomethylpyrimidine kinase